jgi:hypothetical protein
MKKILAILILCCVLAPARPQDPGALWKDTLTQLDVSRKWAAGEVEMISDTDKGGERTRVVSALRLRGWDKQKPVYELIRREPQDNTASVQDFSALNQFSALSDTLHEVTPRRSDGQVLDGVPCTVFETRTDTMLQKASVKLWVDPITGAPRQMVIAARIPLAMDVTITTHYITGAEGQPLPGVVDYAVERLVPFKNSKARIRQSNGAWVARPAS